MKIINKIGEQPSIPEPNYQKLVCDKINEIIGHTFFKILNGNELYAGTCSNQDFTIGFGVITAVIPDSVDGYFSFGFHKEMPILFYSRNYKNTWGHIKLLTKDTTITIS